MIAPARASESGALAARTMCPLFEAHPDTVRKLKRATIYRLASTTA
jgi:hypothetical protein